MRCRLFFWILFVLSMTFYETMVCAQEQAEDTISDMEASVAEEEAITPDNDIPESTAPEQEAEPAKIDHTSPDRQGEDELLLGSPASEIRRAKNAFEYGNYKEVVARLEAALAKDIFDKNQLVDAYRLLGLCYFIGKDEFRTRETFLSLLRLVPEYELNPLYIHPDIIDLFEKVREENRDELDRIIRERLGIEEPKPSEKEPVFYKSNHYFVNYIPFGAGQFQNDETVKGVLFLSGEIVLLGINITGYSMTRQLRGTDGFYSSSDASNARGWQIVQYASLGALVALAVGGVIDAVLNFEEIVPTKEPTDWKPEEADKKTTLSEEPDPSKANAGSPAMGGFTIRF